MRALNMEEVNFVDGGEMTCTASVGTNTSLSCTGSASDWKQVGQAAWSFLAVSPITIPGIITRVF